MAVSADFHFDGHEDWMADNENRELKLEEENLKDTRDADQQASRDGSRPASFRLPRVQGKQWGVCKHFHNVNWCICHSEKLGRILSITNKWIVEKSVKQMFHGNSSGSMGQVWI